MNTIQKPTIAVFLNAYWVHGQGMSGGDQMAIQIFRRIRHAFAAMYWFTNPDGQKVIYQQVKDVSFSATPHVFDRWPIGISYVMRTLLAIVCLLVKRVDIVYSGSDFFPDVIPAWIYSRFYRRTRWVQCVFHIYPDWHTRPGNKISNLLAVTLQKISLVFAKRADGVVNINNEVRKKLIDQGFDPARLVVITPGIDLELIESVAPATSETDRFDALFLGRLNRSKGIFDLPEIWKRVTVSRPGARLGIIGGGSEEIRAQLKDAFVAEGVGNYAILIGFAETKRIYAMMKSARVFVFPSHEEGFGIAIVEALACGLPVVAWQLPVFAELFGDAVSTVPQADCAAFAKAVLHILENRTKPEKAEQCVRQYGWQRVSEIMVRWLVGHSAQSAVLEEQRT